MSTIILGNASNKQDWHPEDIKAELKKRGWSMHKLAIAHGYTSSSAMRQVFYRSYPKVEKIIADALNLDVDQIWPSRVLQRNLKKPSTIDVTNSENSNY